jgi:hypothetical protein
MSGSRFHLTLIVVSLVSCASVAQAQSGTRNAAPSPSQSFSQPAQPQMSAPQFPAPSTTAPQSFGNQSLSPQMLTPPQQFSPSTQRFMPQASFGSRCSNMSFRAPVTAPMAAFPAPTPITTYRPSFGSPQFVTPSIQSFRPLAAATGFGSYRSLRPIRAAQPVYTAPILHGF